MSSSSTSLFGAELARQLGASTGVKVANRAQDAQVILEVLTESREKHILSLSAAGRVREFELRYIVKYRLVGQDRRDWIAPTDVLLRRNLTFDDRDLLAKESEEGLLYRDMKNDALGMVMRMLTKASPPAAT